MRRNSLLIYMVMKFCFLYYVQIKYLAMWSALFWVITQLINVPCCIKDTIFKSLLQRILSTVAQSVQRLTTGWMVRNRIPVGTRFSAHPDRPWDPFSPLYKEYRVFPGGKVRPGRAADHSPPSSALAMEQWSYTSTHPLGHTGPVTGTHYLFTAMNYASFTQCIVICFTNHTKKMHKVYRFEL